MTSRYESYGVTYKKLDVMKYRLLKQYKIALKLSNGFDLDNASYTDGALTLRRGFAWDGPSALTLDTDDFMRGSLVHDCLYVAIARDYLPATDKKKADKILYRLCREDGMNIVRATYVYYAVKWFGKCKVKRTT